jgi:hypothetical protein
MLLLGSTYPAPGQTEESQQYLNLTLLCNDSEQKPEVQSYNGTHLLMEWKTKVVCNTSEGDKGGVEKPPEDGAPPKGSGIGWFFLVYVSSASYAAII